MRELFKEGVLEATQLQAVNNVPISPILQARKLRSMRLNSLLKVIELVSGYISYLLPHM